MFRSSLFIILLIAMIFAAGCQPAEPEVVEVPVEVEVTRIVEVAVEQPAAEAPALNPMMPIDFEKITSSTTGRDYTLTVVLPGSYMFTEADYPVVYVTDGDFYGIPLGMAAAQMAFGQELPEFIVVGVDYGTPDPMEWMELRELDMGLEGSPQFLQFFKDELIPYIETNYRADAANRTLAGHSSGGNFALYAALHGADTFNNFIASAPALAAAEAEGIANFAANPGDGAVKLYMSAGELDEETIASAQAFDTALDEAGLEGLFYEMQILDNETHLSSRPRAFNNGLRWLYANEGF